MLPADQWCASALAFLRCCYSSTTAANATAANATTAIATSIASAALTATITASTLPAALAISNAATATATASIATYIVSATLTATLAASTVASHVQGSIFALAGWRVLAAEAPIFKDFAFSVSQNPKIFLASQGRTVRILELEL